MAEGFMSKVRRVALLSNPEGPGSLAELPRIRAFCAEHPHVFHYEVEEAGQISEAMRSIARVRPVLLAINGGEPTVAAALVELARLCPVLPPVAVVAGGRLDEVRRVVELGA
jgi:hypothetical protein